MSTQLVSAPGVVFVQLMLEDKTVLVPDKAMFIQADLIEHVNAPAELVVSVKYTDPSFVTKYLRPLVVQDPPTAVSVTIGVANAGQIISSRESQKYIPVRITDAPDQAGGGLVKFALRDSLWVLCRQNRVKAYNGKISEIVANIAKANKIAETVVEETTGTVKLVQSMSTDFDMLRRMVPLAQNSNGESNFRFFMRGNALHFHTPGFASQDARTFDYLGTITENMAVIDTTEERNIEGGAGTVASTYSMVTGKSTSPGDSKYTALIRGHDSEENLSGQFTAETAFNTQYNKAYMLEITPTLRNVPDIRINDVVSVVLASQNDTYVSGQYALTAAVHTIDTSSSLSKLTLTLFKGNVGQAKANAQPAGGFNLDGSRSVLVK